MKRQLQTQIRGKSSQRNASSRWQSRSNSEPSSTTSSQMDLVSLNRVLSTLLECPVCFEVLSPPIYQCKVGHNVCRACKEKIKVCPLCRQNLVGRNVTIEHISNNLLRECPNKSSGCMEMIGLDDLGSHERICPFRKYDCIPGKNNLMCVWSGARSEILNHMRVAHPEMAEIGRGVFDLKVSKHEISIVPAFNEIFWYHLKRDSRKKLLYAVVAYIGPVQNASKYRYKWQLYSKTDSNKVTFTNTTISDTCNTNDLFDKGQAVIISYKVVKHFLDEEKKLSWRLKIFVP